jgi:hypothetical protein
MAALPNKPKPTPAANAPAPSRASGVVAIATANVPIIAAAVVNLTRELFMTGLVAFRFDPYGKRRIAAVGSAIRGAT